MAGEDYTKAKARWYGCTNDEATRQFLLDFIEGVIFDHYKTTVIGSVPIQTGTGASTLPFRIKGEINKIAVRRGLFAKKADLEQTNQYKAIRDTMGRAERNRMKRPGAYCRTASGTQGDRLSGLRAQTIAIRRYA